MRIFSVLVTIILLFWTNAYAANHITEITSEPPEVKVTIVTNAWTTRFDEEIEKFKSEGYSAENIATLRSGFDDIKRENPSETIKCITPCQINIPIEVWQRSEIKAFKTGFPEYSKDLSSFSRFSAKTPPKQISLVLTLPKSAPVSCIFDDGYVSQGSYEAQPCYRPKGKAPKSLRKKKQSYYCSILFDLDITGKTQNIQITNCSERKLNKLVLENVQAWRYVPKTEAGKAVATQGLRSTVSYVYRNKNGRKYPAKK